MHMRRQLDRFSSSYNYVRHAQACPTVIVNTKYSKKYVHICSIEGRYNTWFVQLFYLLLTMLVLLRPSSVPAFNMSASPQICSRKS